MHSRIPCQSKCARPSADRDPRGNELTYPTMHATYTCQSTLSIFPEPAKVEQIRTDEQTPHHGFRSVWAPGASEPAPSTGLVCACACQFQVWILLCMSTLFCLTPFWNWVYACQTETLQLCTPCARTCAQLLQIHNRSNTCARRGHARSRRSDPDYGSAAHPNTGDSGSCVHRPANDDAASRACQAHDTSTGALASLFALASSTRH